MISNTQRNFVILLCAYAGMMNLRRKWQKHLLVTKALEE